MGGGNAIAAFRTVSIPVTAVSPEKGFGLFNHIATASLVASTTGQAVAMEEKSQVALAMVHLVMGFDTEITRSISSLIPTHLSESCPSFMVQLKNSPA